MDLYKLDPCFRLLAPEDNQGRQEHGSVSGLEVENGNQIQGRQRTTRYNIEQRPEKSRILVYQFAVLRSRVVSSKQLQHESRNGLKCMISRI